ncbi:hypothetical protein BC835DRAFT_1409982 [Cytidiella melzeri]|nr:hypothetical protein BC835DRAFT_1409982 [Cytidiella melzeri]
MAIIDLARALERRSGSDDSVGSEAGVNGAKPLPTSVKALAGFIVVMGVIILGIAAWKFGKWRRSRLRAASMNNGGSLQKHSIVHVDLSKVETNPLEKETDVVQPYKWRPVSRPPVSHSANKAVKTGTKRFFGGVVGKKPAPLAVDARSPPPAYIEATPAPYTVIVSTPDGYRTSSGVKLIPNTPSSPLPSPARIQSIGSGSPLRSSMMKTGKAKGTRASQAVKPLPRLMAVVCTFTPSLADELSVSIGEPLLLMEEYEDEWCLVQRVGKADAERGVIPRFCLTEAPPMPQRRASRTLQ